MTLILIMHSLFFHEINTYRVENLNKIENIFQVNRIAYFESFASTKFEKQN